MVMSAKKLLGVFFMKIAKKAAISALMASALFMSVVPVSAAENQASQVAQNATGVPSYAKSLLGTPYKKNGTTRKGFDASGFVQYVYKHNGVRLPRTSKEMYKSGKSTASMQPGDLVFFDTQNKKKKEPNYVGIYLGSSKFISVSTSDGVSIHSLKDQYWKSKYIGGKKVQKPSSFNFKNVKEGDRIGGYTVSSVKKGYDTPNTGLYAFITFKEQIKLSGHYKISKTYPNVLQFQVNKSEITKLPLDNVGSIEKGIIMFQDQDKAKAAFKNIRSGTQVQLELKNLQLGFHGKDAWVENAEIMKINK
jgi:hypothetical protein